eukprot:gene9287-1375_t
MNNQNFQQNSFQQQPLLGVPYVGSKICLVSRSGFRYEGVLYSIDSNSSTVALRDVTIHGKDGNPIPGSKKYDYIVFKGSDIQDLSVISPPSPLGQNMNQFNSPYGGTFGGGYGGYGGYNSYQQYPQQQQQQQQFQQTQNLQQQQQFQQKPIQTQQTEQTVQKPVEKKSVISEETQKKQQQQQQQKQKKQPKKKFDTKNEKNVVVKPITQEDKQKPKKNQNQNPTQQTVQQKKTEKFDTDFDFAGNLKKLNIQDDVELLKIKEEVKSTYNKETSFFDTISRDQKQERIQKQERDDQRKRDTETFGSSYVKTYRSNNYKKNYHKKNYPNKNQKKKENQQ